MKETWLDLRMQDVSRYLASGGLVAKETLLREVFVNTIEADATRVEFFATKISGASKLSVEDNGCGMSAAELDSYLGEILKSGPNKHQFQNFGQGVRKATLSRNEAGVNWLSIKKGNASNLTIKLNGDSGWQYTCTKEAKKRVAKTHGTTVTFLGNKTKEDTTEQFGTPDSVASFLRTRFYDLPRPIDTNVFGTHLTITGLKANLNKLAIEQGTEKLPEGLLLHYYILADNSSYSGIYVSLREDSGMSEIYENRDSRELHKYGLDASHRRVVLVIEAPKVTATTHGVLDRTTMVHNDVQVTALLNDDAAWPKMLRDNMPDAVKKFEKEELERQINPDQKRALRDYKLLMKLYPNLHFGGPKKKSKSRDEEDDDDSDEPLKRKDFLLLVKNHKGKKQRKGFANPRCISDDKLETVVLYNPKSNTLFFNFSHPLAKVHERQFLKEYGSANRVKSLKMLHEVWRLRAKEAVLAVREANYTDEQITPEALTTAILLKSTSFPEAGKRARAVAA